VFNISIMETVDPPYIPARRSYNRVREMQGIPCSFKIFYDIFGVLVILAVVIMSVRKL
jgi:hypothetical protein